MNEEHEGKTYRYRILFETEEGKVLEATGKIKDQLKKIGEEAKKTNDTLQNLFTAIGGVTILQKFGAMATEITEIDNRLHVLNQTVINTKLHFQDLVGAANRSRASLKDFSEFFMRIGMSSAEYFADKPGNLIQMAEILNKQFQLMHLNPQQLMSVQTAILDAMELGYFDWRHLRAGIQHDNPLFKGYLNYMGFRGEQGQQAARSHQLTAQSFTNYVLQEGTTLTKGFAESQITLKQLGFVLKNDVLLNLQGLSHTAMDLSNVFYRVYTAAMNLTTPTRGLGTDILGHMGLAISGMQMGKMAVSGAMKLGRLAWTMTKRSNPWLLGTSAALGIGRWVYDRYYRSHGDEGEAGLRRKDFLPEIQKDVHDISQQMGLTRETLNDLVSRTESLLIRTTLQGGMGLDGTMGGRNLSERLAQEIKRDLDRNGIGF